MKLKTEITLVGLLGLVGIIINFAVIGGIIWVAWHFISKWW